MAHTRIVEDHQKAGGGEGGKEGDTGGTRFAFTVPKSELFVDSSNTRIPIKDNLRRDDKSPLEAQEIGIDTEVFESYRSFLTEFVRNLARVEEDPVTSSILHDGKHHLENQLLELLSSRDEVTGKVGSRGVDESRIVEILKTGKGLGLVTQLIEQSMMLRLFSIAEVAIKIPSGDKKRVADELQTVLNHHRGLLKRLYDKLPGHGVSRVLGSARVSLVSGLLTKFVFLTSGPQALAVGAGVGGFAFLADILISSLRTGDTEKLEMCREAFKVIAGSKSEREYVRTMVGIDVSDTYYGTFPTRKKTILKRRGQLPGRHYSTVTSIRANLKAFRQESESRMAFYTNTGVPHEALDALPEQFIYDSKINGNPELTGTVWQQKTNLQYDKKSGDSTEPPATQLTAYYQARRENMLGVVQEMLKDKQKKATATARKADVQAQLDALAGDSSSKPFKAPLIIEQENLDRKIDFIKTAGGEAQFDAYSDSIKTLEETRAKLRKEHGGRDTVAKLTDRYDTLTRQLEEHRAGSPPYTSPLTINEEYDQAIHEYKDALTTGTSSILDPATAGTPASKEALIKALNLGEQAKYQTRIGEIKAKEAKIREDREKIGQARIELQQKLDAVDESGEVVKGVVKNIDSWRKAFTELANPSSSINSILHSLPPVLAGLGLPSQIDRDYLADDAISDEVIMNIINKVNEVNNSVGWPEAENYTRERMVYLEQARLEAKANQLMESRRGAPTPNADFTSVVGDGITLNQLISLNFDELLSVANDVNKGNPGLFWPSSQNSMLANRLRLENAIKEAKLHLDGRKDAVKAHVELIVKRKPSIELQLEKVDEQIAEKKHRLEMYKVMSQSQTALLSGNRSTEISELLNSAGRGLFDSDAKVYATEGLDTFLPSEITLLPGYATLLNLLIKHRSSVDGVDMLKIAQKMLPLNIVSEIVAKNINILPAYALALSKQSATLAVYDVVRLGVVSAHGIDDILKDAQTQAESFKSDSVLYDCVNKIVTQVIDVKTAGGTINTAEQKAALVYNSYYNLSNPNVLFSVFQRSVDEHQLSGMNLSNIIIDMVEYAGVTALSHPIVRS